MKNIFYINSKGKSPLKKIFCVLGILALAAGDFGAGMYFTGHNEALKKAAGAEANYVGSVLGKYGMSGASALSGDIDFNLFWDVWDALEKDYVDKAEINEKEMFYGAIKGMAASLGDPYTVFMDPKVAKEFENDLAGTFEGIGAEIGIKNDVLTIIAPLPDMPAEKAGLRAGDNIFAIDGATTTDMSVDEAVNRIRGPEGTKVALTIYRKGEDAPQNISITRGKIVVKSIKTELRDDNIFVITIANFNDDTKTMFDQAASEAVEKNPKGVILDLRNNPGGYLDTAVEVASEWVEDGIIVSEQFSGGEKNEYLARGRARLKGFTTVVLVDGGSASASEIVAGALQDNKAAKIVGMKTFGKGSVQTLDQFGDGSSLKVTVAKWLTPNGNCINEQGITPDIEVDLTKDDYNADKDPQLDKAVEILLNL